MKRFALLGNPNCGKTTLFNALTGSTAHVGNWPGVTVDRKEGTYKKLDEPVSIVDLPGIYSLSPYTPEEVIARNFIIDDKPECVINIIDSTNLERNLYLTTQALEMDVPVVVALNMIDVLEAKGESIDVELLSKEIGVPVVAISAQKGTGLDELMSKAYEVSKSSRVGVSVLSESSIKHIITDVKAAFTGLEVSSPLFHAIKLIENDEIEAKNHPELVKVVNEFKKVFDDELFGNDLEAIIADARYKYITAHYVKAKSKQTVLGEEKFTKSDKIDRVLTHKILGIPIFLVILFLIFHFTFSENLFYLGGLFSNVTPSFAGSEFFEGAIWSDAGINSIGVILQNIVIGTTDFITSIVAGWLETSPAWVSGLICDGILAGVFAVLSFVPQILLLFLFFSILEDSGYMARIAFILDRIFRKFGLSGRAFLPMIMGFGCSVPAMINTRTLADENERTATVRVIPFFSCGAKLPILVAIAGGICEVFDFPNVDLITYSMYVLGIVTAIITILIMRNTTMRGNVPPFIMELPEYHLPGFKPLMLHLWDKLKHFIKKAFTIILASTIVIWFLQSFTFDWKYIEQVDINELADGKFDEYLEDDLFKESVILLDEEFDSEELSLAMVMESYVELEEDEQALYDIVLNPVFVDALNEYVEVTGDSNYRNAGDSILAGIGKLLQPVFTPAGFGSQLNENGWVYGVSAVTGLIAKENVIATFNVLANCTTNINNVDEIDEFKQIYISGLELDEGTSGAVILVNNTGILDQHNGWAILIAFIVFNMTTIPCFAAVSTAKGELTKKKFIFTLLFWLATSYIASMICYLVLSWWWTVFVVLGAACATILGIILFNKKKKVA